MLVHLSMDWKFIGIKHKSTRHGECFYVSFKEVRLFFFLLYFT